METTFKHRDVEEPKNIDSTLLDISELRDNMSKGIYDGNKNQDSDKVQKVTPIVKKSIASSSIVSLISEQHCNKLLLVARISSCRLVSFF